MHQFKVIFHFDKENTNTLYIQGESREQVMDKVFNAGEFFEGEKDKGIHRINMKLVLWVSVY